MNYNKTIGKYGETIAADYLINNGYEILDRNFQTRYGEVDIIWQKDDMIIFFEIKSPEAVPDITHKNMCDIKYSLRGFF